jgi:hypothetical protein
MSRDNKGRFITGGNGGPGRPPGSRNRLAEDFLSALCADWYKHGPAAIAMVRLKNPTAYVRVVAGLVQRDQPNPATSYLDDYTDLELIASLKAEIVELERLHPEIANTKPPKRPHEF